METRSSCCMKARRLNGCLRLKGDVSYRKEGGQGGKGRERGGGSGVGEAGWKGTEVYKRRLFHNLDHWKLLQNRIGQN